jgi:hypothetical protein
LEWPWRGGAGAPSDASRQGAVAWLGFCDSNGFRDRLAELVAIPSTSQDPGPEADVQRRLDAVIRPWLERRNRTERSQAKWLPLSDLVLVHWAAQEQAPEAYAPATRRSLS